jgi:protein TonB
MEQEPGDSVEGEWDAGATPISSPPARRPRDVVRLGRLGVPVAAAAWGLSLTAHGAAALLGLAVLRYARSDTPPGVSFSQGDGGTSFGVYRAGGAGGEPSALPPPPARAAPSSASSLPPVSQDEADLGTTFERGEALPLSESDEGPAWIGVPPSGGERSPDAIRRNARPPGGPGGSEQAGDVAGGIGSSGDDPGNGTGEASDGSPGVASGIGTSRLPAPVYPRESRLRGEQGTVVLEVDVDADGTPAAVRVVEDAGYPRLAAAAVEAARKARFRPATRAGQPVAARVRIPFRFTLR